VHPFFPLPAIYAVSRFRPSLICLFCVWRLSFYSFSPLRLPSYSPSGMVLFDPICLKRPTPPLHERTHPLFRAHLFFHAHCAVCTFDFPAPLSRGFPDPTAEGATKETQSPSDKFTSSNGLMTALFLAGFDFFPLSPFPLGSLANFLALPPKSLKRLSRYGPAEGHSSPPVYSPADVGAFFKPYSPLLFLLFHPADPPKSPFQVPDLSRGTPCNILFPPLLQMRL